MLASDTLRLIAVCVVLLRGLGLFRSGGGIGISSEQSTISSLFCPTIESFDIANLNSSENVDRSLANARHLVDVTGWPAIAKSEGSRAVS